MTDSLRDRIAALLESLRPVTPTEAADAVIRELGLRRESRFTAEDGSDINVSEWDRGRMKTPSTGWQSRYCTKWTAEDD